MYCSLKKTQFSVQLSTSTENCDYPWDQFAGRKYQDISIFLNLYIGVNRIRHMAYSGKLGKEIADLLINFFVPFQYDILDINMLYCVRVCVYTTGILLLHIETPRIIVWFRVLYGKI